MDIGGEIFLMVINIWILRWEDSMEYPQLESRGLSMAFNNRLVGWLLHMNHRW